MTLYDKRGVPIREYDVLKLYHFTGRRNKKHYMYKWVVLYEGHLCGNHLCKDSSLFRLTPDICKDAEIVQGYNCIGEEQDFNDRPRKKLGGEG